MTLLLYIPSHQAFHLVSNKILEEKLLQSTFRDQSLYITNVCSYKLYH